MEYYIQNGYDGNAANWWAKDSGGYTTDIAKAHRYSRQEAINICITRKEDRAWPCSYIDGNEEAKKCVIDTQYLDNSMLLEIK